MEADNNQRIFLTPQELQEIMKTADPVGAKINNPLFVWLCVVAVVAFTGNLIYGNMVNQISANEASVSANTELINELKDSVKDIQRNQTDLNTGVLNINTQIKTNAATLSDIKSSRFTNKDAEDIKIQIRNIENLFQTILNDQSKIWAELSLLKASQAISDAKLEERQRFMDEQDEKWRKHIEDTHAQ